MTLTTTAGKEGKITVLESQAFKLLLDFAVSRGLLSPAREEEGRKGDQKGEVRKCGLEPR